MVGFYCIRLHCTEVGLTVHEWDSMNSSPKEALSSVFLSRMDRCIQVSTNRKAHCLLCSWPKDQTGIDLLAGGDHIDGWEGAFRWASACIYDKSGRAFLAVVLTRSPRSLHTPQVQVHPINWLTDSHCLVVAPLRKASTNPQSFFSRPLPQTPHNQASYCFPFYI